MGTWWFDDGSMGIPHDRSWIITANINDGNYNGNMGWVGIHLLSSIIYHLSLLSSMDHGSISLSISFLYISTSIHGFLPGRDVACAAAAADAAAWRSRVPARAGDGGNAAWPKHAEGWEAIAGDNFWLGLVGGLEQVFIFPNNWDDDPIWRTHILIPGLNTLWLWLTVCHGIDGP